MKVAITGKEEVVAIIETETGAAVAVITAVVVKEGKEDKKVIGHWQLATGF
jgi:hypothetical protein